MVQNTIKVGHRHVNWLIFYPETKTKAPRKHNIFHKALEVKMKYEEYGFSNAS